MPADMKDAPEIVIPAEFAAKGNLQRPARPRSSELYTKIWTELLK